MLKKENNTICNDNSVTRWHFNDTGDFKDLYKLLKHIPQARQLIKRYCKQPWKYTPDHKEFTFLEFQLCTLLDRKEYNSSHREMKIKALAMVLETKPLLLFNDRHLQ